MKCSTARRLISDSLDSALRPQDCSRLKKHLEECKECREILCDFQEIVKETQELEIPSPSALAWPAILAKLNAAKRTEISLRPKKAHWLEIFETPWKLRFAVSAALVLAVIFGAIIIGVGPWRGKEDLGISEQERFTLAKVKEAEHHYQLAIKALTEAVASQKGRMEPQVARILQSSLGTIDLSLKACQDAVRRDPGNLEARIYLLSVYREKVNFLDNVMEIEKKSSVKNGPEKTI